MLYKFHSNILIVGLLVIGFLAVMMPGRAFCPMTLVTVFAFVTQLLLIISFTRKDEKNYTDISLFLSVLIYSTIIAVLFMFVSSFYDNDTFMFSKSDAFQYYHTGLRSSKIGLLDNIKSIVRDTDFDDWGGFISASIILYVLPSKFFLNAVYILSGALSAVMLYRIGKHFMPDEYAFCGAFAYSASSYMILFHCTCLKESLFIFFVIAAMYYFYQTIQENSIGPFIGVILCLFIIFFYRPSVTAFLAVSFVAYYAVEMRKSAVSIFLFIIIAVGIVVSFSFMQQQVETYTVGDIGEKIDNSAHGNYTGSFNSFVNWVAAPLGPFPSFFPKAGKPPSTINFYGAGLLYRLFLDIPFWVGIIYTIRRFNIQLIPLVLFVIIEMLATAYVLASIELRKVLPHIPFMSIIMFYGLYELSQIEDRPFVKMLVGSINYILVIGLVFLWNVIKTKG